MERLWGKKAWHFMIVAVATLGTNLITYTICVYNYQQSLSFIGEELITNTKLNVCLSQNPLPTPTQSCNCTHRQSGRQNVDNSTVHGETHNDNLKTIFIITPTYKRSTQKVDLTSMCHTLMHVPNVVWIIIEDAPKPTQLVTNLLQRCKVKTVHLIAATSTTYKLKRGQYRSSKSRGVEQRNVGLTWLRKHYSAGNCNGVVYLGDDDNKYDLRLFDEIRKTDNVSIWKVAWTGDLQWAGPTCRNGRVISWDNKIYTKRMFLVDMAGFAIHLCQFFKHPKARVGVNIHGKRSKLGFLETDLLEHFTSRSLVECRGSEKEVYVWHSHTSIAPPHQEKKLPPQRFVET